jgi:hypothetical protein
MAGSVPKKLLKQQHDRALLVTTTILLKFGKILNKHDAAYFFVDI